MRACSRRPALLACRRSTSRAFLSRDRGPKSKGMSWAAAGGSSSSRKTQWRSPAPVAASTPHAALRLGSLARDQLKSRHVCADFMRSIVRDSANAIGPSGLISKKRRQVCLALCVSLVAPRSSEALRSAASSVVQVVVVMVMLLLAAMQRRGGRTKASCCSNGRRWYARQSGREGYRTRPL